MRRLSELTSARPWTIIGIWLAIVVAAVPFAARQGDHLSQAGYTVAGSQSAWVDAKLREEFPRVSRASLAVLLWPQAGASTSVLDTDIRRVQRALRGLPGVSLSNHDVQLAFFGTGLLEPVVLPLTITANEAAAEHIVETLRARLKVTKPVTSRVEIHLLGQSAYWAGLDYASKKQLTNAEIIGFPVLFAVLFAVFGSLSAAALPVALGVISVLVTGALIYFLSMVIQLSVFVTDAASLLGIGVAIDYSLIVLTRVRQELRAGSDFDTARRRALSTSGRVVIVSGAAVVSSLTALWLIRDNTLRSMALGAIIVVAVSVLACITLLPALISVLGERRLTGGLLTRLARRRSRGTPKSLRPVLARWTGVVTEHPFMSIVAAGSVMLALCLPALSMHTRTEALKQLSPRNETRVGFTEAATLEGPGALGPVNVIAHANVASLRRSVKGLRQIAAELPDVHSLGATRYSHSGNYALFTVIPNSNPEGPGATELVKRLRGSFAKAASVNGVSASVGGTSASLLDIEQEIASNMWEVILAVLLLAFCVLMVLLRSVLLPLKAIVLNLISVGAAYGALVVVFQWGWFDSLFGFTAPGYVDTLTPALILAIVFGLSMDYEVFLLSRIRECWLESGDARGAVTEGLHASARTISSAALILVCAFSIFVDTGLPSIKEIGLGAGVAIALDATLIRLVLVPAAMVLLGKWSWWLPSPLERAFPVRQPNVAERERTPSLKGASAL